MRGEHTVRVPVRVRVVGSSPHARGARGRDVLMCFDERIIPACAGSTKRARHGVAPTGDHPRMRGEH